VEHQMLRLRVKEVAKEKGISMTKLFHLSEVSYTVLSNIFRNPYHVTTTITLDRLAEALGVPTTDLMEDVSEEYAQAEKEALSRQKNSNDER
jgi:transcriptional regulator with XRE-family HTH domain